MFAGESFFEEKSAQGRLFWRVMQENFVGIEKCKAEE
jgi:hypothetical protein